MTKLMEIFLPKKPQFTLIEDPSSDIKDLLIDVDFIKGKGKKKIAYSNIAASFDIESSSFYIKGDKRSCMYAFVLGINGRTITGRTWSEFINYINIIKETYKTSINKRFIIYVHNLGFEFQWFRKRFEWFEIFSLDQRRPIYACTTDGIEFRCSLILSNLPLSTVGKNLTKYKVSKMVGDLDYKLIRHSTTKLSEKEWRYIINDGLIVMAYIQELIEFEGDITEIPLTNTGFVRKLCKEKCLKGDYKIPYKQLIRSLKMDVDEYKMLKQAYSGGFTHANANYVQSLVEDVHSFDFTSSYPACLISEQFPMSSGKMIDIKNDEDFYNKLNQYCCLFHITFYNIKAKVNYENYISKSKCWEILDFILNNGRVVSASKLSITITEQDFFIIKDMYDWDGYDVYNFIVYMKDYLPKPFVMTVLELYKDKTILKGVEGKELEYNRSKANVNSLYGMCVTDPAKDETIYEDGWSKKPKDLDEVIKLYNNSNSRFLFYGWGVWITAYARRNLFSGIQEFKDDYLYADTDSLKVINIEKHMKYIENYNKNIKRKIKKALRYNNIDVKLSEPKTINGISKPLGVWDYEGKYDFFKTLGAKRYMICKDGKINITISGVKKENGNRYLEYKYKNVYDIFVNFNDELCFPSEYINENNEMLSATGKSLHTYIDIKTQGKVIDYLGSENDFEELSSMHLEGADYSISLSDNFLEYLVSIKDSSIL